MMVHDIPQCSMIFHFVLHSHSIALGVGGGGWGGVVLPPGVFLIKSEVFPPRVSKCIFLPPTLASLALTSHLFVDVHIYSFSLGVR